LTAETLHLSTIDNDAAAAAAAAAAADDDDDDEDDSDDDLHNDVNAVDSLILHLCILWRFLLLLQYWISTDCNKVTVFCNM